MAEQLVHASVGLALGLVADAELYGQLLAGDAGVPCPSDGGQDLLFDGGGVGGWALCAGHGQRRSHKGKLPVPELHQHVLITCGGSLHLQPL